MTHGVHRVSWHGIVLLCGLVLYPASSSATRQLAHATPDGKPRPYNYAVGHLGHEIGHRWSAYVTARVNGQTISLGAWPHWDAGLQARVAYPYSLPLEASTEGGGVWQDNRDGTFTRLRDGYFVPASGYSYLDPSARITRYETAIHRDMASDKRHFLYTSGRATPAIGSSFARLISRQE